MLAVFDPRSRRGHAGSMSRATICDDGAVHAVNGPRTDNSPAVLIVPCLSFLGDSALDGTAPMSRAAGLCGLAAIKRPSLATAPGLPTDRFIVLATHAFRASLAVHLPVRVLLLINGPASAVRVPSASGPLRLGLGQPSIHETFYSRPLAAREYCKGQM